MSWLTDTNAEAGHDYDAHLADQYVRDRKDLELLLAEVASHSMHSLISFRESTPPQNRQLIVYYYRLKY